MIVQLDDDLVAQLDQVAAEEGASRSELLRRGARAVIDAHRLGTEERTYVEAYRRQPDDPEWVETLHRLAARNWPE